MKKLAYLIGTLVLMTTMLLGFSQSTFGQTVKFKDMKGHWAEKAVQQATEKGFIEGYQDNTFRPEAKVTRAEFATFLSRVMDQDGATIEMPFTDVPNSFWGKEAIEKGVSLGYIVAMDYPGKKFVPNQPITRLEMARMLSRALATKEEYQTILANFQKLYNGDIPYTDWKSIKQADVPFIAMTIGTEIVNGYPDGSYGMDNLTNRAEAVVMLTRFKSAFEKQPTDYQYVNELNEVALTGTNALTVSSLKTQQEHYGGLEINHSLFDFVTKRVYVIPLHDKTKKKSLFERKFIAIDRKKLFEVRSNYADGNIVKGVVVTVGDMTFHKTENYYHLFTNRVFANGNYFFLTEPMQKYGLEYVVVSRDINANMGDQTGKKGETKEFAFYGGWSDRDVGVDLHLQDLSQSHSLFFNPYNNYLTGAE